MAQALFDAVQAELAAQAVQRQNRLKGSPAILMGRIFDEHSNRMSPTHSNKGGVRYRHYVSHAVVQGQKAKRGARARVPARELEIMIAAAVRQQLQQRKSDAHPIPGDDLALIEQYVQSVNITSDAIEICWLGTSPEGTSSVVDHGPELAHKTSITVLPWISSRIPAKGVVHAPSERLTIEPETRIALLEAIAKARSWIDDLVKGRAQSLAEIAHREHKVERHPAIGAVSFRFAATGCGAF